MTTSLEKILKHFINGKEYSPGLIVNIVSVETDKNNNIRVVFDIDNVGDVPYNLLIIGVNLREEIEKLSKYISFEANDGIFEGLIKVMVYDTEHLESLNKQFEQIDGVERIERWDMEENELISVKG